MTTDSQNPPEFEVSLGADGKLALVDASYVRHEDVRPVRAFPISQPGAWIALCDSEGHELALVEDLRQLSSASRSALERALARREFMPVIRKIRERDLHSLPAEWDVETDRGPTRLELNSEDDVRPIGDKQALIIDARGVRFLVADIGALDPASRNALERYL